MKLTSAQFHKALFAAQHVLDPVKHAQIMSRLYKSTEERRERLRSLLTPIDGVTLTFVSGEVSGQPFISMCYRGIHMATLRDMSYVHSRYSRTNTPVELTYDKELSGQGLEIATEIAEAQVQRLLDLRLAIRGLPIGDLNGLLIADYEAKRMNDPAWPGVAA